MIGQISLFAKMHTCFQNTRVRLVAIGNNDNLKVYICRCFACPEFGEEAPAYRQHVYEK